MIVSVQTDYGDELATGIELTELDELREWFCYTKPLGPSVKIVATPAAGERGGFSVVATGNEPGGVEKIGTTPAGVLA